MRNARHNLGRLAAVVPMVLLVCPVRAESPASDASRGLRPWPVVLPVVHVAEEPTLDGQLNDPVWKDLMPVTNFVNLRTGQLARSQTSVLAVFDEKCLYLGIMAYEQKMDEVISVATTRDGAVYCDNAVELFICPSRQPGAYAHLAVNSLGTQFDQWVTPDGADMKWNANWTAKVAKQPNGWSVEIAIPFETFRTDPPMPGTVWRANVTRVCGPTGELTTMARLHGGFHQPDKFVSLRFCYGPGEARVRIKHSLSATSQPAPAPEAEPAVPELPVPAVDYARGPAKVTPADDGWLMIDGKPFFPRILFLNQGFDGIAQAGFNAVLTGNDTPDAQGAWIKANLDSLNAAQKQGLWVLFHVCNLFREGRSQLGELRQMVLALKDHPALLGWYTADEPSGNVHSVMTLRAAYTLIKKLDGNHPVFLLENTPAMFSYWARGTCDVFMTDPYPIPHLPTSLVADWTVAARKATGKGQTTMICLQAHGPPFQGRFPTVHEAKTMAYLAVMNGATGLGWWAHGPARESPIWAQYPAITGESAALATALRSATNKELSAQNGVYRLSFALGGTNHIVVADTTKDQPPTTVVVKGDKQEAVQLLVPAVIPPGVAAPPPPAAPPPTPTPAPAPPATVPAPAPAPPPVPPATKPATTPPAPAPPPPPPPPATKPAPAPTPPPAPPSTTPAAPPPPPVPAPPPPPPASKPTTTKTSALPNFDRFHDNGGQGAIA